MHSLDGWIFYNSQILWCYICVHSRFILPYVTLSNGVLLQRDTTGLTSENTELKLRLQAMEQQAQLRDGMHFWNPNISSVWVTWWPLLFFDMHSSIWMLYHYVSEWKYFRVLLHMFAPSFSPIFYHDMWLHPTLLRYNKISTWRITIRSFLYSNSYQLF